MKRSLLIFLLLLWQCVALRSQQLVPHIESIKNYGGSGGDGNSSGFGAFHFTQDGFILYAGSSNSIDDDLTCNNPVSLKAWLLKTDKQGNLIFSKCFGGALQIDSMSSSFEFFTDMAATKDSGCIAACYTNAASFPGSVFPYACADSVNGYKDMSLVKYDKDGNVQWSKCYGGGQDDGIMSIANTSDGGYIFLAQVRSTGGEVGFHYGSIFVADAWLVKVDSAGDIQWKEVLGGTGYDYPSKVKEISPGRYMTSITTSSTDGNLTGLNHFSSSDAWFCILDSAGNIMKQKFIPWYGNKLMAYDFINTADGGLICAGKAFGNGNTNNSCTAGATGDFAIFELDTSFQIQWCNIQTGSEGPLYSITELKDSVFVVCGTSSSTTYNAGCAIDTNGASIAVNQGWMMGVDIAGNVRWLRSICASNITELNYSLFDTLTGAIYLSGDGYATDGDLSGVPNYGESDLWLFKMALVSGINPVSKDDPLRVYPNPSSDKLYVDIAPAHEGKITLMDIAGKEISAINGSSTTEILHIGDLPAGVYILMYQDANVSISKKIIKE